MNLVVVLTKEGEMILTTHILIAAVAAKPLAASNAISAFFISLISHFLTDAIPHWQYHLKSVTGDGIDPSRKGVSFNDYLRVGTDALIGSLILFYILNPASLTDFIFWAAVILGGVLPDFLQFLYIISKSRFLKPLSDFHRFVHSKTKIKIPTLLGIPLQIIIILTVLFAL